MDWFYLWEDERDGHRGYRPGEKKPTDGYRCRNVTFEKHFGAKAIVVAQVSHHGSIGVVPVVVFVEGNDETFLLFLEISIMETFKQNDTYVEEAFTEKDCSGE